MRHQHGNRFMIGLGLTNIANLTSGVEGSWRLYSKLQASRRAKQYRNLTTWWLRKILDRDLYFSLDRLIAAMHASKLQVFFPLLTPVVLIEITVKNQDVQNRQNVSRIVCLAYSTLQLSDWTHIERNALSTFVRSTYSSDLHWTTLPSAKDRVFFVLLGGDWGEGTRKRAVTDGKGAHVHCSTCSRGAYIDFSKAPYV